MKAVLFLNIILYLIPVSTYSKEFEFSSKDLSYKLTLTEATLAIKSESINLNLSRTSCRIPEFDFNYRVINEKLKIPKSHVEVSTDKTFQINKKSYEIERNQVLYSELRYVPQRLTDLKVLCLLGERNRLPRVEKLNNN